MLRQVGSDAGIYAVDTRDSLLEPLNTVHCQSSHAGDLGHPDSHSGTLHPVEGPPGQMPPASRTWVTLTFSAPFDLWGIAPGNPLFDIEDALCLAAQSCLTLSNPMDCRSSVQGNSPGKNTEEGCHASSRGSSQPSDQTQVSRTEDGFFTVRVTREARRPNINHVPVL